MTTCGRMSKNSLSIISTTQKIKFSIKGFFSSKLWLNPQETADLIIFTKEILNETCLTSQNGQVF